MWGPIIPSFRNEQDVREIVESTWAKYELVPLDKMGAFSPVFPAVLDYINGKTGGARMTRRSDINPAEITPLLPHLALLDVINSAKDANDMDGGDDHNADNEVQSPSDYIFRLMGTSISGFYGELTGQSVRNLPNKQAVDRLLHACTSVMETRESLGIFARSLSDRKLHLQAVAMYIPLAGDHGDISQILITAVVQSASV